MDNGVVYISSDGTEKDISKMHSSYLMNADNKKKNALFECQTTGEVEEALKVIKALDEEYYKRVESFLKESFDEEGNRKNEQ